MTISSSSFTKTRSGLVKTSESMKIAAMCCVLSKRSMLHAPKFAEVVARMMQPTYSPEIMALWVPVHGLAKSRRESTDTAMTSTSLTVTIAPLEMDALLLVIFASLVTRESIFSEACFAVCNTEIPIQLGIGANNVSIIEETSSQNELE